MADKFNIEICNKRNIKPSEPYDFSCDRTTVLGNHIKMKNKSLQERNRVCDEYQEYFDSVLQRTSSSEMIELNRILFVYRKYRRVRLFCWCVPERCHVETIRNFLIMILKKENRKHKKIRRKI